MNRFDLDALAERSGLKLPSLAPRRARFIPAEIIVGCAAASLILASLIWLSLYHSDGVRPHGSAIDREWQAFVSSAGHVEIVRLIRQE